MERGGPWDAISEPLFNRPGGEMSEFVGWLFTLEASFAEVDRPMLERITAQPLPDNWRQPIARIAPPLLAHSPSIRHQIKLTTEYHRGRFGLEDSKADKNLIAANQQSLYEVYRIQMERSGRWAILFSDSREGGRRWFSSQLPSVARRVRVGPEAGMAHPSSVNIVYMVPFGGASHRSAGRYLANGR